MPEEESISFDNFDKSVVNLLEKVKASLTDNEKVKVTPKQRKFLRTFFSLNSSLQEACRASGATEEEVNKWFRSYQFKRFIKDSSEDAKRKSKRTIEKWKDLLWDCLEGRIKFNDDQIRCLNFLGKFYGVFSERLVTESYRREEYLFTNFTQSPLEYNTTPRTGIIEPVNSEVHISVSGEAMGEIQVPSLLADGGVRQAEVNGVVRNPAEKSS